MSDSCPVLTDIDIELMGRFRNEIAQIQADKNKLFEECDITEQSGGGLKQKFIAHIAYIIAFCIISIASGATSAFLVTIIPEASQMYILSLVNLRPTLPMCGSSITTTISATFWSNLGFPNASCSDRAKLFYDGIQTITNGIGLGVGTIIGVSSLSTLKNKVENYIYGLIGENVPAMTNSTPYSLASGEKTNIYERGGRRKSRNGKRKTGKSRKIRRSRKY